MRYTKLIFYISLRRFSYLVSRIMPPVSRKINAPKTNIKISIDVLLHHGEAFRCLRDTPKARGVDIPEGSRMGMRALAQGITLPRRRGGGSCPGQAPARRRGR